MTMRGTYLNLSWNQTLVELHVSSSFITHTHPKNIAPMLESPDLLVTCFYYLLTSICTIMRGNPDRKKRNCFCTVFRYQDGLLVFSVSPLIRPHPLKCLQPVCSPVRHLLCPWFRIWSRIPPPAHLLSSVSQQHWCLFPCSCLPFSLLHLLYPFLLPFDAPPSTTAAPLIAPLQTTPRCRWT